MYNLRYLPVIDFLPYKTGVKIAEKMVVPDGVQVDEYLTTFIYEKEGVRKEFNLSNYPAEDTTWKFVDQKSVLIKKGYKPPIHDFIITSMNGEDLTKKILSFSGYSVLMISRKLALADKNIQWMVLISAGIALLTELIFIFSAPLAPTRLRTMKTVCSFVPLMKQLLKQ